jgi:hypothetical protein
METCYILSLVGWKHLDTPANSQGKPCTILLAAARSKQLRIISQPRRIAQAQRHIRCERSYWQVRSTTAQLFAALHTPCKPFTCPYVHRHIPKACNKTANATTSTSFLSLCLSPCAA